MVVRSILEKTLLNECRRKVVEAFQWFSGDSIECRRQDRVGREDGRLVVNITVLNQRGNRIPASGGVICICVMMMMMMMMLEALLSGDSSGVTKSLNRSLGDAQWRGKKEDGKASGHDEMSFQTRVTTSIGLVGENLKGGNVVGNE